MGAVTTEFWNVLSWSGNSYTSESSLSSTHLCELFLQDAIFPYNVQEGRNKEKEEGRGEEGRAG